MSDQVETHFDKTMKKIELVFQCAGINMQSGEQRAKNLKSCLIFFINFVWMNIDLAGAIYWFIDGVQTGKDFLSLTYIAPCISLASLANCKGIFLVLNEINVHKLIGKMREFEIKDKGSVSEATEKMKNKERNFLNLILNVANTTYIVCVIAFALMPIVIVIMKYYKTHEVELMLPFLILYPFDPYDLKVWPFVYFHQVCASAITAVDICAADYFFFICCTYLRIQFKLLQYELENLIPEGGDASAIYQHNESFRAKFRELVIWHQELIEAADLLEIIYTRSTLFNFLTSSFIICLTGFNMTKLTNAAIMTMFMAFHSLGLIQVFFLCFFADLLNTSSMEISDGVYRSKWYLAEARVSKSLLIMLIRSQKPCKITASGFADVNLNSFMRVMSSAWSYFALLQTIYATN